MGDRWLQSAGLQHLQNNTSCKYVIIRSRDPLAYNITFTVYIITSRKNIVGFGLDF